MTSGEWRVASGEWRVASGEWRVTAVVSMVWTLWRCGGVAEAAVATAVVVVVVIRSKS